MTANPTYLFPDWPEPSPQVSRNGDTWAMSPSEIIALYLKHLETRVQAKRLSQKNFDNSKRDLEAFAAHCERLLEARQITISGLEDDDLVGWVFRPSYKSGWTKRRVRDLIMRCFKWAAHPKRGYIAKCPFEWPEDIRFPKPRRENATAAEYRDIMKAAHARGDCKGNDLNRQKGCRGNQPLRIILFILWHTSLRPEEARELEPCQVDLEQCCIELTDHKTVGQMAEPESRIIGLDGPVVRLLRNLIRRHPAGQRYLLRTLRGRPWTKDGLDARIRTLRKHLGIMRKVVPYSFRHSGATEADMGGMNQRWIADHFGHTTVNLVQIYSHAAQQKRHMRRVAREMTQRRREVRRRVD